ncbi:MAG: nitroreductase family protein [Syntrophobacteraceae bacterium]
MADIMDVIKGRRSIRRYEDKDIPEELVNKLLEAVQWSPSWANTQCWEVVVVKDAETKQKLQETLGKGNPAGKAMVEAPVVIVMCGKVKSSGYYKDQVTTKFGDWLLFDVGIATQSLCLEAHSLGLGTVIAGLFDHDKARAAVNAPEGVEVVAIVPLGYSAKESSPPKRREIAEFTHYGSF